MKKIIRINKQAIGYGYFVVVILLSVYILFKSSSIMLEDNNHALIKFELGVTLEDLCDKLIDELVIIPYSFKEKSSEMSAVILNELLPVVCYVDNYGLSEEYMYCQEEIPKYFYETEETKNVETINVLEAQKKVKLIKQEKKLLKTNL